jgi:hypothetical protein
MLVLLVWLACAATGCSDSQHGSGQKSAAGLRIELTLRAARGPLRIAAANSRYFADDTGKIVYLTGSHTWNNFQDWGSADPPPVFDYQRYLDFLAAHGLNFFRLYVWEQAQGVPWSNEKVWFAPMPYERTGPGTALDGQPRFDLQKWNPQYFERLRTKVRQAGDRGIYVSVMLFNGWSVDGKRVAMSKALQKKGLGDPWTGHPFNRENNINGVDGGGWGKVHTLQNASTVEAQKAYVRKVIDAVGDLDNVLWEISNENNGESTPGEYEMIRFIHDEEAKHPKQHPVGMTAEYPDGKNADLWNSPAEWVSPGGTRNSDYAIAPPSAVGGKVIVSDTDHIWGIGGSEDWIWKSFTRGLNTIFMDPYEADLEEIYPMFRTRSSTNATSDPHDWEWEAVRNNLGYTHAFSERMNMASPVPHGELSSTGYCLAAPGTEYLVYLPPRLGWSNKLVSHLPPNWLPETVEVDLSKMTGNAIFEWFQPSAGETIFSGTIATGGKRQFHEVVRGGNLVLYIHSGGRQPR